MADDLKKNNEKPLDNEVTELDDESLEEASGGLAKDSGDIVINNCNC